MFDDFCSCEDCAKHRALEFAIQHIGNESKLDEGQANAAMSHATLPFIELTLWQRLQIWLAPVIRAMR